MRPGRPSELGALATPVLPARPRKLGSPGLMSAAPAALHRAAPQGLGMGGWEWKYFGGKRFGKEKDVRRRSNTYAKCLAHPQPLIAPSGTSRRALGEKEGETGLVVRGGETILKSEVTPLSLGAISSSKTVLGLPPFNFRMVRLGTSSSPTP